MERMMLWVAVAGLTLVLAACGTTTSTPQSAAQTGGYTTIGVAELEAMLSRGDEFVLLDVRSPEEFSQDGHIAEATLLPLPELGTRMSELAKDEQIVCICRSGNRSRTACDQLAQAGYTDLINVDGGMVAWGAAGYPIVRP